VTYITAVFFLYNFATVRSRMDVYCSQIHSSVQGSTDD